MIREVKLYHVICDGCEATYPHNGVNEEVFFERKTALTTCICAGWAKVDGKLYCPDCYENAIKKRMSINRKLSRTKQ